jgi:phosphatidylglycerophosphatase A
LTGAKAVDSGRFRTHLRLFFASSLTAGKAPGYSGLRRRSPRLGPATALVLRGLLPAVPGPGYGAIGPSEQNTSQASPPERGSGKPLVVWIATAGGLGFAPGAPGTVGAAAGVGLFWLLTGLSLPVFLMTVAALSALGVWSADGAGRHFAQADDGRIVIDEVAGQLLALAPLLAAPAGARSGRAFFFLVVTGFVAFRLFDIGKPGPVGWAERRFSGGAGVMADDLVAGALAAAVVAVGVIAAALAAKDGAGAVAAVTGVSL